MQLKYLVDIILLDVNLIQEENVRTFNRAGLPFKNSLHAPANLFNMDHLLIFLLPTSPYIFLQCLPERLPLDLYKSSDNEANLHI